MNPLCLRCLEQVERLRANYCPNCGRRLGAMHAPLPTGAELTAYASDLARLLSKLKTVQTVLDDQRLVAEARGYAVALDLIDRRSLSVSRITLRLQEQRRQAGSQLRLTSQ